MKIFAQKSPVELGAILGLKALWFETSLEAAGAVEFRTRVQ